MNMPIESLQKTLNKENYYSNETDLTYMSFSLFKKFVECEANAYQSLSRETDTTATALIAGNYVHSYFESEQAHEKFIQDNKKYIFTKTGNLKSDFKKAENEIRRLKDWTLFDKLYQGEKESIVTGQIGGVEWKGKIDCLNVENGYFGDIKTTKDFKPLWNDRTRKKENFVIAREYTTQMYIYKTLLEQQYGKEFTPLIFAVTKEEVPDIKAISFQDWDFTVDEEVINSYLPKIMNVLYGIETPTRCEHCDYCKATKNPLNLVSVMDF